MIWVLVGVVVLLCCVVVWLVRTIRRLAQSLAAVAAELRELQAQALPLIADTRSALRKAEGANRRTDALLDVATSLTGTADQAAKLATKVVTSPVVKVLAFFTGIGRGVRRLFSRA
jgi:uncharacterized protein YoxC